jgi:hypothetical protein
MKRGHIGALDLIIFLDLGRWAQEMFGDRFG